MSDCGCVNENLCDHAAERQSEARTDSGPRLPSGSVPETAPDDGGRAHIILPAMEKYLAGGKDANDTLGRRSFLGLARVEENP